jgi:mannose-6-phosphate isomerase-like protein (cupin superfamily)
MTRAPLAWLIAVAMISGCASKENLAPPAAHFLAQDPPRAASFDAMIEQAALHPEQNIRQLLLHQGESMSVHLVRIRDREQPHLHTRYDLTVMLVEGEGTLWLQGEPLKMRGGDVAVISKGTRHHFVNEGSEPASALVVFAPAYDESDREAVEEPE